MADAVQPDVKPQGQTPAPAAETPKVQDSSPVTTQQQVGTPPASEQPSPAPVVDKKPVPYNRFQEVVKQKNDYDSKIKEMEKRLSKYEGHFNESMRQKEVAGIVQKMVSGGMDEGVAKTIAESLYVPHIPKTETTTSEPVDMPSLVHQASEVISKFAESHKDFDEYSGDMHKMFENMSEAEQRLILSSDKNFELLYSNAKIRKLEEKMQQQFNAGAQSAYDTKGVKQAMTQTPQVAVPGSVKLDPKDLLKMSDKDYLANRAKIFEAFGVK